MRQRLVTNYNKQQLILGIRGEQSPSEIFVNFNTELFRSQPLILSVSSHTSHISLWKLFISFFRFSLRASRVTLERKRHLREEEVMGSKFMAISASFGSLKGS